MNRNSKPFIESLESRQLLTAAATLPDLTFSLAYTPPALVQPGASISPKLTITNAGSSIKKKSNVPINLYVSTTPTLAPGSVPFKVIDESLKLAAGQSTTVTLTASLPLDITSNNYYLIVEADKPSAVHESNFANNIVVSKRLHNPVATYAGHFTSDDGRYGTLNLAISSESSINALFSSFTASYSDARIHIAHLRTHFTAAGVINIASKGHFTDPFLGRLAYGLTLHATFIGKSLTGTFHLHWHTPSTNRNATSTFKLTR
jgi:CARDB